MTKSELLAQAEALEWVRNSATTWSIAATLADVRERITELRAQAAAMPDAEPVAIHQWRRRIEGSPWRDADKASAYSRIDEHYEARTLYTAPPEQSAKIARMRDLLERCLPALNYVVRSTLGKTIRAELEKP